MILTVIVFLMVLAILGAFVVDKKSRSLAEPHNIHYKNLQKCYLVALYLVTFADWLQGPYVYKLYKDYGYKDDTIALFYITGFASSCIFGTVVGVLADKYGRKILCSCCGILYSLCCLTKLSSHFGLLLVGRVLGGISTSIMFTTFEAWYVNEHLNFYKLPPDWLNVTFTKATFFTGLSAIIAGLISQISVEYFNLGTYSPFMLAIPFLLLSFLVIQSTWKEHTALTVVKPQKEASYWQTYISPLHLFFKDEKILLYLGAIQSIFESVMYIFVFSWTPVLNSLKPPLGLVFSLFMISLMAGSKLYATLISKRYHSQHLLIFTNIIAMVAVTIVALSLTTIISHAGDHDFANSTARVMSLICFGAFMIYELSVGMYYPAMSYLRGRIVPEECRAALSNWLRVPMNVITCLTLTMKNDSNNQVTGLKKFQTVFALSSVLMTLATFMAFIFSKKYSKKIIQDELIDMKEGKIVPTETV